MLVQQLTLGIRAATAWSRVGHSAWLGPRAIRLRWGLTRRGHEAECPAAKRRVQFSSTPRRRYEDLERILGCAILRTDRAAKLVSTLSLAAVTAACGARAFL
jgi:hypothetical protein